jgi:hypothetical protein
LVLLLLHFWFLPSFWSTRFSSFLVSCLFCCAACKCRASFSQCRRKQHTQSLRRFLCRLFPPPTFVNLKR